MNNSRQFHKFISLSYTLYMQKSLVTCSTISSEIKQIIQEFAAVLLLPSANLNSAPRALMNSDTDVG